MPGPKILGGVPLLCCGLSGTETLNRAKQRVRCIPGERERRDQRHLSDHLALGSRWGIAHASESTSALTTRHRHHCHGFAAPQT
jgi:hypothetical protein